MNQRDDNLVSEEALSEQKSLVEGLRLMQSCGEQPGVVRSHAVRVARAAERSTVQIVQIQEDLGMS